MAGIFQRLILFKQKQKAKWTRLLRLRVLVGRMKLNRILLQWKVLIRKRKVERLRYTIISHRHYKTILQQSVTDWRTFVTGKKRVRSGFDSLQKMVKKWHSKVIIAYLSQNLASERILDIKAAQLAQLDE